MKRVTRKTNILVWPISLVLFLASVFCTTTTGATQVLEHVGREPVDFSLQDSSGKTVTLADYSDKKAVVLLFWSTWSRRSKEALERMNEYYQSYRDRGVQVIGINADSQQITGEERQAINAVVSELGIAYPIVLDHQLETFHAYGIVALPSTVVIAGNEITYVLPGQPLIETDNMFDYLLVLAGETPKKKVELKPGPSTEVLASLNLARKLIQKKMAKLAEPLLRKAIDKDPGYMPPYLELAKLYESEGRPPEAENILRQALEKDSENQTVMGELGFLLTNNGRVAEAIAILKKASGAGSDPQAYAYLAYAQGRNGKLEESLASFDKALELNPFDHAIYELRAGILEANGRLQEACADYRKELELMLKIRKQPSAADPT